jgi:hypothetical protein
MPVVFLVDQRHRLAWPARCSIVRHMCTTCVWTHRFFFPPPMPSVPEVPRPSYLPKEGGTATWWWNRVLFSGVKNSEALYCCKLVPITIRSIKIEGPNLIVTVTINNIKQCFAAVVNSEMLQYHCRVLYHLSYFTVPSVTFPEFSTSLQRWHLWWALSENRGLNRINNVGFV